jgi:SPP1 gp7 family putative phage head morphogenesis protein
VAIGLHPRRVDATPKRRSGPRLPPQLPPTRIEQDYAAVLIRMVGRARAAWAPVLEALPSILAEAEAERGGARQDSASSRARALIKKARAAPVIDTTALQAVARKFAGATEAHQKEQLARQARAAIKVDPVFKSSQLRPLVDHFVAANVALVKRIPARLHDDLEVMITHAVASGRRHPALTRDIKDRFGVAEKHARLIARDQIGKFHAKVNHHRQQEMGVTKFIWRSVGDERVREWHQELDGTTHSFDKPPRNPDTGERVLPGDDVQCRCSSEPLFSED